MHVDGPWLENEPNRLMKSIVIYNPISGHGHLDSWCAIFTKVLLESGWKVLVITPNQKGLIATLSNSNCLYLNQLKVIPQCMQREKDGLPANSTKALLKRLWRKINTEGYAYVFNDRKLTSKRLTKPHEKLLASSYLLLHYCRYFVFPYVKVRFKAQDNDETSSIFALGEIEKEIEGQKFEANLIFHMYLDSLNIHDSQLYKPSTPLKFKWAGIRFAPEVNDSLYFIEHLNLKGIAFLDEDFAKNVAKSLPNVHVRYLPDIANLQLSKGPPDISNLIVSNANGRMIVFLGGIIGLRKNLTLWLDLVEKADPKKWYFVQIGEIDFKDLKSNEFLAVYKKLLFPPENFMLVPSYIADESIFNSIISISNIIFAVYKDFRNSSNMITKASFFHKPILVSDRYLMGRRVQAFGVGVAVSEDNVQKMILGLEKLASEIIPSAKFDSYNNAFNQEIFGSKFLNFVDKLNES